MLNDLNNMRSFSLDIPVLKETIVKLEISIKNIEKIGTDVENIGDMLVSESWEGNATNSFKEHQQYWKKDYDEMLNQLIDFKESLEKVVLAGAEAINELALELPVPLGGSRGTGYRSIISMEQEGIEELKAKCKTLVYEDYECQREIMGNIEGLSSRLHYSFSIGADASKNKKTIEENQEKLQAFKIKLQNYEDGVLLFEKVVVDEMSKYAVVCGHKLSQEDFRTFLQYQKDDSWKALITKKVDELSDIEKLVLKAEYESGITDKISQYISRQLGIENLNFKDLTFEDVATIWARNRRFKLGELIDEVSIILNKLEMAESAIELKLGIDIKSVVIPTAALKVLKEINQAVDMQGILKNVDIQKITKTAYNGLASVLSNTQFDKILNISYNSLDGIVAFIQDKEYTWEDKGVLYSLNQAFDKTENCEDKLRYGNASGACLNLGGEFLGFLQTLYLNYENNCDSLENGHGFQTWKRKMDFADWEEEYYGSRGVQPLSERISEDNKFLGFTYGFVMQIVTDPLTWIGGAVGITSKMGKASKADELLKGTKEIAEKSVDDIVQKGAKVTTEAAEIEIPKAGKEFDTVLKQGDELDNIIEGGSESAKDIIKERLQGFDLEVHPIENKQLSSSRMKELKEKIGNRAATKEEYKLYDWNKRLNKRRSEGVKDFWNQERERIMNGESPTRNWNNEQSNNILSGKTPKFESKPIQGHHSYSVSQYPQLANKGEVIFPATANEHLNGWHGGNYRNSLPGEPIKDIVDFE